MKVALIVGHKESSPGAGNAKEGINEYVFNNELAHDISDKLGEADIRCEIVYRDEYSKLPFEINLKVKPDFIVSLHCNAFDTMATGTEVLYYHSSSRSKQMAEILQKELVDALKLRDRGIRERHTEDRGGYLLRYTEAPCVICEPFFIDNDTDCRVALEYYDDLVMAYVNGIEKIVSGASDE